MNRKPKPYTPTEAEMAATESRRLVDALTQEASYRVNLTRVLEGAPEQRQALGELLRTAREQRAETRAARDAADAFEGAGA